MRNWRKKRQPLNYSQLNWDRSIQNVASQVTYRMWLVVSIFSTLNVPLGIFCLTCITGYVWILPTKLSMLLMFVFFYLTHTLHDFYLHISLKIHTDCFLLFENPRWRNKGNSSIPLFKTHKSMDKKQNRGNKLKLRETH